METLPGDYIAGFVDGEGCFALKFRRDFRADRKSKKEYFYWDIEFAILLREDDRNILEQIQKTLNCGRISVAKRGSVRYAVNDLSDLMNKVVPFFKKYRLRAKKRHDFLLWKQALEILKNNQQRNMERTKNQVGFSRILWSELDIKRLRGIHEDMAAYKSKGNPWKWLSKS